MAGSSRTPTRLSWRGIGSGGVGTSTSWAADLCTVQTLTFRTRYGLVFITHGRRELVHVNVTARPSAAWVWRRPAEATAWGRRPRFLRRDRDAVSGGGFANRAAALGIESLLTPCGRRARTPSRRGSSAPSGGSVSTT
jgi:hypothetical protein